MSPLERVLWTILALVATVAGVFFFIVDADYVKSGVSFLAALVLLNWRTQGLS